MVAVVTRPGVQVLQGGDRLTQFKDADASIREFLKVVQVKGVEAGYAWREVVKESLWDVEYPSLEAYIEALRTEYNTTGYKQVMQLISFVDLRDELISSGTPEADVNLLGSQRSVRALKAVPKSDRPTVLKAVAEEVRDRGLNSATESLVKNAQQDLKTQRDHDLSFEEVQRMFAPYGTFRRINGVFNRRARAQRLEFIVGPNMNNFRSVSIYKTFKTLDEALIYYAEFCQPRFKLTGKGCLTCKNCSATEGNEIWCNSNRMMIPLHQTWEGMKTCAPYEAISGGKVETDVVWGEIVHSDQQVDLPMLNVPTVPQEPLEHPAGILGTAGAKGSGTDEHYSPEKYWRPWLEATGEESYDLDAFTHKDSPIPTKYCFTKREDGLVQDWAVLGPDTPIVLWDNFPYSMNAECTQKFCEEFDRGTIGHALILEKTDNGVGWYQELLSRCTSFLLIDERVKHINEAGEEKGGFFSSTLFYFGDLPAVFHDAYCHLGAVCQVMPSEMYGR